LALPAARSPLSVLVATPVLLNLFAARATISPASSFFFALLVTIQGAVIFSDGYLRPLRGVRLPPSCEDDPIARSLQQSPDAFPTRGTATASQWNSKDSPHYEQGSAMNYFVPEKGDVYTINSGDKTYTITLQESLYETDLVWEVMYTIGASRIRRAGVAKTEVTKEEADATKKASEAFDNYLYIAHDNEWMLLKFLQGPQTKDIPNTKPSDCRTIFETAKDAATEFQKELFKKVGFIQSDRSSDNFIYDDDTFEKCKGIDFGLVDNLEEIEPKDRDKHIENFMQEIFDAASTKRCKKGPGLLGEKLAWFLFGFFEF